MKIDRSGNTRLVIIFKTFVIKFPTISRGQFYFLRGCTANLKERYIYLKRKLRYEHPKVVPTWFCFPFGLFAIQPRCVLLDRFLTEEEKIEFASICNGDDKKENFGFYKGSLVCLDYGK